MSNEQGKWNIAVVGATGLVGSAVVEILAQRGFPLAQLTVLASEASEGNSVAFGRRQLVVHSLSDFDFRQVDLALFCVPAQVARQYAPHASAAGCVVVDLSSAFRDDPEVPLVAAGINPQALAGYARHNLIASPDSSVLNTLAVLQPLRKQHAVSRITALYLRAVSELGRAGVDELSAQSIALFNLKPIETRVFGQQIAFNILARAGGASAGAERDLEQHLQSELKKILEVPDIEVSVTAMQVPVFFAHSASLQIEFDDNLSMEHARETLAKQTGIQLVDETEQGASASPVTHATADDQIFINRLRQRPESGQELEILLVADNIRTAANNGVHIAEILVKDYL